ncbi:MAG: hypothetical protein HOI95_01450 [Chromatiales bacterium]|nr:hypothetical protein [Chromatiales bacterium]
MITLQSDPFLEMNINMDGGLTVENFLDTLDWWRIVVRDFKQHIDW